MARERKDYTGVKFNYLTVIKNSTDSGCGKRLVYCKCDCGNERDFILDNVKNGSTKSCGCFNIKTIGALNRSHGKRWTIEYNTWCSMKARCYRKTSPDFATYGGVGIIVCDRWINSFQNFFDDMGSKPTSQHSIDRIDTNGNYEPSNCRWATKEQQSENRKSSRTITFNGKTLIVKYWLKKFGINRSMLRQYSKKHGIDKAMIHYSKRIK